MEILLLFIFTIFIFMALYIRKRFYAFRNNTVAVNGTAPKGRRRFPLFIAAVAGAVFTIIITFMFFRSTPHTVFNNDELIRIVMVGKTGVGKSATGNTILGQKKFKSDFSAESLTKRCGKAYGEVNGQKVAVIDTPGVFDTKNTEEETAKDIAQSISYASPGPHIFLVIIRLGRFTEEEKQTVEKIQKIFSEEADKYSMILFTHGDLLRGKTIEEFLKDSKDLQELVRKCYGRYHVFDNELKDRSQVRELLKKIRKINMQNGGSHYTTEMFQEAEKVIEEKKQRILKEKDEEIRKEREKLRKEIEEEYQQQLKEVKDEFERRAKLMEERDKKIQETMKKLREEHEDQARKESEDSDCCSRRSEWSHYTTKMFQRAERAIKEKKQQILKENEEQMLKEQDELMKEREENINC